MKLKQKKIKTKKKQERRRIKSKLAKMEAKQ